MCNLKICGLFTLFMVHCLSLLYLVEIAQPKMSYVSWNLKSKMRLKWWFTLVPKEKHIEIQLPFRRLKFLICFNGVPDL